MILRMDKSSSGLFQDGRKPRHFQFPIPLSVTVLEPVLGESTEIVSVAVGARPLTGAVKVMGMVVEVRG